MRQSLPDRGSAAQPEGAITTGRPGPYAIAALVSAFVSFLPFVRGVPTGQAFFFRDLSRYFFPARRFVLDGLAEGELRFWNPFVHEGELVYPLPLSYPLELLQLLRPDEAGLSAYLALHVPLGAVFFVTLGRRLGLSPVAAAMGAVIYGLGGFSLSCLNFYVYTGTLAWAPLVVWGVLGAAAGGPRQWVSCALVTATAISTGGAEIVIQAILVGLVLTVRPRQRRGLVGPLVSLTLASALAAWTLVVTSDILAGGARQEGFSRALVLSFSVHPITLLQVIVANLHGDLGDILRYFWGGRFFPGYPYFLSLYVGATALALAVVGCRHGGAIAGRALALAVAGLWIAMGTWSGLGIIVEAVPALRAVRFPAKAFFTVHLAASLLAALGLEALSRSRRAWLALRFAGLLLGGLLVVAAMLGFLVPAVRATAAATLLPDAYGGQRRELALWKIATDAGAGGLVAATAGLLAALVSANRFESIRAQWMLVFLGAADLLRAGAGLNPMVTTSFYSLSPEMEQVAYDLRASEARIFACDPEFSPAFYAARGVVRDAEARTGQSLYDTWLVAVYMETLVPNYNMQVGVRSALSRDLDARGPQRALPDSLLGCRDLPSIVGRLRNAGVTHLTSLEPLDHSALLPMAVVRPQRIAPATIHVYALRNALGRYGLADGVAKAGPDDALQSMDVEGPGLQPARGAEGQARLIEEHAGRIAFVVQSDRSTTLVLRDSFTPGWRASVDGRPTQVFATLAGHRAVPVPSGTSRVVLDYRPPRIALALGLSVGGILATAGVWYLGPRVWLHRAP